MVRRIWPIGAALVQEPDNLVVQDLMKINIVVANGIERFWFPEANDFVDPHAQIIEDMRRRDRNSQHKSFRHFAAQRRQRSTNAGACCNAVVDQDQHSSLERDMRAPRQIDAPPALYLGQLGFCLLVDVRLCDRGVGQNVVVDDNKGFTTVDNGCNCQLRLKRHTDLAHEDEIERRTKRTRHLDGHRNTTTGHRQNHRIAEPELDEPLGESLPSCTAIRE